MSGHSPGTGGAGRERTSGPKNGIPRRLPPAWGVLFTAALPAAFAALAFVLCLSGLPAWLTVMGAAGCVCLGAAGIVVGRRYARSENDRSATPVERWCWAATLFPLASAVLILFILDIDYRSRILPGTFALGVFLAVSLAYIAWARRQPGAGSGRTLLARPGIPAALENVLLMLLSAFLFALSFPGFVSPWGIGPLAYVSLAPAFIVIARSRLRASAFYGALFGFAAHALFNFWLALFNPVALSVVLFFRVLYFMALFPLLKLAILVFPRGGFLAQAALWTAYEFFSAQGFIAYSYGILGYSQYLFGPVLQLASLTSVWGISLLVVAPGAYLGNALAGGFRQFPGFVRRTLAAPVAYACLFAAVIVFGIVSRPDGAALPTLRVACIQTNVDPWTGGDPAYETSLRILLRLSERAETEKPDLIVWPETALVPSLRYHLEVRDDLERYHRVIRPFVDFMEKRSTPYLIGNNDRVLVGRDAFGRPVTKSYNAVLHMEGKEIRGVYRKTHLVPFTEHFPYRDVLPGVYDWLAGEDTHFYDAGDEDNADRVFDIQGVRVSSLICFEDTFGEIARRFTAAGADLLVNHTNDAWSQSEAAEMQHLAIAVFRAVETRRSLVRATASGITAVIDPAGEITGRLPRAGEGVLVRDVPVNRGEPTFYVAAGEWCGWLAFIFAGAALLAGAGFRLRRVVRRRNAGADIDKNP